MKIYVKLGFLIIFLVSVTFISGCLAPRLDVKIETEASKMLLNIINNKWMLSKFGIEDAIYESLKAHIKNTNCKKLDCLKSFGFDSCEVVANGNPLCRSSFKLTIRHPKDSRVYRPDGDVSMLHINGGYAGDGSIYIEVNRSGNYPFI